MKGVTSRDAIQYLGEVAAWIENCPDGTRSYGEYYVADVTVKFDGEVLGRFVSEDPDWLWEPAE